MNVCWFVYVCDYSKCCDYSCCIEYMFFSEKYKDKEKAQQNKVLV